MDLQVTIAQVSVRNLSSGKTVYDVLCGDNETRQVWEAPLANAINAFSGTQQPITIREQVKQNGQYTNRSITAFAPPGQALPADIGTGGTGGRPGFGGRGGGMSPDDKTRIAKMGAQGSASTLVAALFNGAGPEAYDQAVELFDKLVLKLYKSARSHEKPETQVLQTGAAGNVLPTAGAASNVLPQAGQPVTGAEIAAAIPGVQVGVAAAQDAAAEVADKPATDDIDWT